MLLIPFPCLSFPSLTWSQVEAGGTAGQGCFACLKWVQLESKAITQPGQHLLGLIHLNPSNPALPTGHGEQDLPAAEALRSFNSLSPWQLWGRKDLLETSQQRMVLPKSTTNLWFYAFLLRIDTRSCFLLGTARVLGHIQTNPLRRSLEGLIWAASISLRTWWR